MTAKSHVTSCGVCCGIGMIGAEGTAPAAAKGGTAGFITVCGIFCVCDTDCDTVLLIGGAICVCTVAAVVGAGWPDDALGVGKAPALAFGIVGAVGDVAAGIGRVGCAVWPCMIGVALSPVVCGIGGGGLVTVVTAGCGIVPTFAPVSVPTTGPAPGPSPAVFRARGGAPELGGFALCGTNGVWGGAASPCVVRRVS